MTKSWKESENQFNGEEINSFKQHSLDSYYLLYLVPKQAGAAATLAGV